MSNDVSGPRFRFLTRLPRPNLRQLTVRGASVACAGAVLVPLLPSVAQAAILEPRPAPPSHGTTAWIPKTLSLTSLTDDPLPLPPIPSPVVPLAPPVPVLSPGQNAVNWAVAREADPRERYVWGGLGPTAFDCSGLTMKAWSNAGVILPRTAAAQYNWGVANKKTIPANVNNLQPGDLLFFYNPIAHVAMYIGNGQMVEAIDSQEGLKIKPFTSNASQRKALAVRPG